KPILLISIDANSAKLDTDRLPRMAKGKTPLSPESMKRLDEYNEVNLPKAAFDASPLLLDEARPPDWLKSSAQLTDYVSHYFARPDLLAKRSQHRWYFVTRLLYILAPLAVLVVAAQVTLAPNLVKFAWIEFAILVVIIVVLSVARRARWH